MCTPHTKSPCTRGSQLDVPALESDQTNSVLVFFFFHEDESHFQRVTLNEILMLEKDRESVNETLLTTMMVTFINLVSSRFWIFLPIY